MIGVVLMMRSAGFIMLLVVLVLCALWSRCGKVKCAVGKTTVEKRKGGLIAVVVLMVLLLPTSCGGRW